VRSSSRQIDPVRDLRHDRSSELAHERDLRHARCSERSYLFTMSDIIQISAGYCYPNRDRASPSGLAAERRARNCHFTDEQKLDQTQLVEPDGIEPTTSCLQSRRSPN
jgi:hypothetical protein